MLKIKEYHYIWLLIFQIILLQVRINLIHYIFIQQLNLQMIYKNYFPKMIHFKLTSSEIFPLKLQNFLEKINRVLILLLNYNFIDFVKFICNSLFADQFILLCILIYRLLMESMVKCKDSLILRKFISLENLLGILTLKFLYHIFAMLSGFNFTFFLNLKLVNFF